MLPILGYVKLFGGLLGCSLALAVSMVHFPQSSPEELALSPRGKSFLFEGDIFRSLQQSFALTKFFFKTILFNIQAKNEFYITHIPSANYNQNPIRFDWEFDSGT